MTNILFISSTLKNGGTETFMMNVVKNSDRNKYHYDFLIFKDRESNNRKVAEKIGCNVYCLPSRRDGWNLHRKAVCDFFKHNASKYQAIHYCMGDLSDIITLEQAYHFNIPVRIIHSHNSSSEQLRTRVLHWLNKNKAYKLGTHFFACSTAAADNFYGKKDSLIISNGVKLSDFSYSPEIRKKVRNELGISANELVIANIGRFEDVKNHPFMIDIFEEVLRVKPDSLLLLIGTGNKQQSMIEKVRSKNIYDKVRFLGIRNDVAALYQAMDIFLMPSLFEGLPFVLVEAQTAALPCVISDTINQDVKLTDDLHFLSLGNDASFWADKILRVHQTHIRKPCDTIIKEKGFSIDDTVKYLESVYSNN